MDEHNHQQARLTRSAEETYSTIRGCVITAQNKVAAAVNTAMVLAYHEIGEQVYKACGDSERTGYGERLLQYLSDRLTAEFGKGFTVANLRNMRQFYCMFPKRDALRSELSWTHYRLLMRIRDAQERQFYLEESAKSGWSSRELMNEGDAPPIGIVLCADKSDAVIKYTLPEDNNQIFASKYFTYLPTAEELKRELRLDGFRRLEGLEEQ